MKDMSQEQLQVAKDFLYHRLAVVAGKKFCFFRMVRMHRLNKRLDSLNRGMAGGK